MIAISASDNVDAVVTAALTGTTAPVSAPLTRTYVPVTASLTGVTGNPIRAYYDPGGFASGSDPPPDQFY